MLKQIFVPLRKTSASQLESNLHVFLKIPGLYLKGETEQHTFPQCFNIILGTQGRVNAEELTVQKLCFKRKWFILYALHYSEPERHAVVRKLDFSLFFLYGPNSFVYDRAITSQIALLHFEHALTSHK